MQKYYFIPYLPNFWATFLRVTSFFLYFTIFLPQKRSHFLQKRRTCYSKEDVQKKEWRGEMTLTKDLALESHQLKAGDVEQTDVATINRDESFFRQLRQRADGVGSIHITQRS